MKTGVAVMVGVFVDAPIVGVLVGVNVGGTGVGVLQKAADEGKYSIGVDSNQNHLQPGTMLTSMVKKVGEAAYASFTDANSTILSIEEVQGWNPGQKGRIHFYILI